jgi:hypothetical protein
MRGGGLVGEVRYCWLTTEVQIMWEKKRLEDTQAGGNLCGDKNSKKPTFPVKVEMVWVVDELKNQKNERFLTSPIFPTRPRFYPSKLPAL